jgi:ADP-ribose pyrophosphatase
MPLRPWKKLRTVFELRNPWWTYRRDDVILPGGKQGEYHYVHVDGSSLIVPRLPDGRIILVRQYRYLGGTTSLEFPCGSVKPGSSYDETAVHELAEETGYESADLCCIGTFNPYNGVTDEMCRVFLADNLRPVPQTPDETEEFEQVTMAPAEIDAGIASGEIWDGMTMAAWTLARPRLVS